MVYDKRLKNYIMDFPLFVEVAIFFLLLLPRVRDENISGLITWVKGFKKGKKLGKDKLEVVVVFTDYILHNIGLVRNTCLNRSLVLFHFLNRMGEDVVIHFGVRKEDKLLKGHGWLAKGGRPFLEKDSTCSEFRTILTFSTID